MSGVRTFWMTLPYGVTISLRFLETLPDAYVFLKYNDSHCVGGSVQLSTDDVVS